VHPLELGSRIAPRPCNQKTCPRSTGLSPDINSHQKSAPETNSKANWWRTEDPARLLSGSTLVHKRLLGYLRAVWMKIFGQVFQGFRPEIDPGTPLDRPGPPRTHPTSWAERPVELRRRVVSSGVLDSGSSRECHRHRKGISHNPAASTKGKWP